jgi:hypothetical protein
MTITKTYSDLELIIKKYKISPKRMGKIIKWIECSKYYGINLRKNTTYAVPYNFDYLYSQEGVDLIEQAIYRYSETHPKLAIKFPYPTDKWDISKAK